MLHGDRPSAARRCALKAVTQVGVGVHGKNKLITLQAQTNPHCEVPLGKSGLPPLQAQTNPHCNVPLGMIPPGAPGRLADRTVMLCTIFCHREFL